MCNICGQPDFVRCNCVSAQPFCDQCAEDTRCTSVIDAQCVIYHFDTDTPSALTCLGITNGTSLETILETLDDLVCNSMNIPFAGVDTDSIHWVAGGPAGHNPKANLNLSPDAGNLIVIRENGVFAGLENQITGCTSPSGDITITANYVDNIYVICADIDYTGLIGNLCDNVDFEACIQAHETPITPVDTASIHLSVSGQSDHTLQADAKISAVAGNGLILQGDGLYAPSGGTVTGAVNGLHLDGSTVKLGGDLIENTTVSDRNFNLTFDVNVVNIGDDTDPNFVQTVPYAAGENRKLQVLTRHDLKDSTAINTYIASFLTLVDSGDVNATSQWYAEAVVAAYNFEDDFTTSTGMQTGSIVGQCVVATRNNAVVSYPGGPISGVSGGVVPGDGTVFNLPNTTNQGSISKVAGFRAIQPTIDGGTNLNEIPDIGDYIGYWIDDLAGSNFAANVTNWYAIYQLGVNDISRFFGPVQNAGGSTQFTSDERVKENIASFERGLAEIEAINPKVFNYVYNKDRQVTGVIAQELEQIIPEAVTTGNFENPKTGEKFDDFRMVDQNVIFYTLVNAIKELSTKNKALEARVKALEL